MVGTGSIASVEGFVESPNGQCCQRIQFPDIVPASGICKAIVWMNQVGVHQVHVKICGTEIEGSPVKLVSGVRECNLLKTYKPPMNQPHDITKLENMFVVTDKSNNQVQVFDSEFHPTNKFCSPESTDMGKFDPYAVAWTGKTLVVTDLNNHCVVEFKNFVPFQVFGKEKLKRPCGIAVGKDGSVYVADCEKHCIFQFNKQRECTFNIGGQGSALGQLNAPWFLAINSSGNLVVSEFKNRRVQVFDPQKRQPIRIIDVKHNGKSWDCRGLALDQNDNIYVTVRNGFMRGWSSEHVLVYAPNGDFLGAFGEGFNYVRGITVTKKGEKTLAYVVDGANHRILEYEM
ncbi:E3 ubiquitin-protein ligase TRIM71-like [Lytechinus variegatus]|uniref:E3 ubiquitin-protein ligase TRIM71-like n=1 Tax=Lytechinus variegatus TaxID=7654 RepID=UPI001BB14248|nr:E3 ubiquitin-protein ligase TRIM71-like [Lytechinus variegatus]